MENEHFTGLLPDTRSETEQSKDWLASELIPVTGELTKNYRVVSQGDWKKYQTRNQDGSGSCVANTVAKMLEVKRQLSKGDSVKFSHAPIYIHRSNKPATGMIGVNALDLACKFSSCKEEEMPSENMNDQQLDALKLPENYEDLNNLVLPTNFMTVKAADLNFDYVASLTLREGCAMVWVNTDYANWCKDIPTAGGIKGKVVHSITAVDVVNLDGEDYIVVEDSWGKWLDQNGVTSKYGPDGQRLLSRSFFADAVWFAAILLDFEYDVTDEGFEPFTTVMEYGQRSDEIKRYQQLLQARGFFPKGEECTGYFGNITARSTYVMQVKYNVAPLAELNTVFFDQKTKRYVKGGRVGGKTLKIINAKLLKK